MDYQDKIKISELIVRSFEGDLTDQQRQELNDIVGSSTDAAAWYLEFTEMLSCFTKYGTTDVADFDFGVEDNSQFCLESSNKKVGDSSNVSLRGVDLEEFMADVDQADVDDSENTFDFLELLEMERISPAVVIEKSAPVKPKRELIQKVENDFKWFPGEGNKPLLVAALAMVACVMVFVGYLHFFVPDYVPLPIVAELADSIDAVWDDEMTQPDEFGDMVQSKYRLKKGYASILFNSGVKVTVEAPAEMSLMIGGNMELYSGKIYAVVPERAKGFSVKTGGCKIIDLGTEFGVEVDSGNNIQVHVIKGKTLLYSGSKDGTKKKNNVDAGAAKKVYSDGFVKDVSFAKKKFVRHINSETGVIFNGQYSLVHKDTMKGRHSGFYLTDKPDSPKGVTVSIYPGKYNSDTDYDSLSPQVTKKEFQLGALPETTFPELPEDHTSIVRGYIELPSSGMYIFQPGWEETSNNVMELNGSEVYRKKKGEKEPVRQVVDIVGGKRYSVKIIYFKRGSSAFWGYRVE